MYMGFLILKDSKSAYLSFHNEYDPDHYSHTYKDDMSHVWWGGEIHTETELSTVWYRSLTEQVYFSLYNRSMHGLWQL